MWKQMEMIVLFEADGPVLTLAVGNVEVPRDTYRGSSVR